MKKIETIYEPYPAIKVDVLIKKNNSFESIWEASLLPITEVKTYKDLNRHFKKVFKVSLKEVGLIQKLTTDKIEKPLHKEIFFNDLPAVIRDSIKKVKYELLDKAHDEPYLLLLVNPFANILIEIPKLEEAEDDA